MKIIIVLNGARVKKDNQQKTIVFFRKDGNNFICTEHLTGTGKSLYNIFDWMFKIKND
ncbi:hypothetical protein GI482_06065 [Bacillus sp. N3536]|nr:hypothetical protein GI482_06065 [Bacillus sp. N3536]